jgi:hypothetical protein
MSAYTLQQYLFDQIGRWGDEPGVVLDPGPYELTEPERVAVTTNDIAALYGLGVHPVLLNAWCRATGHTRDDYRRLLAPYRRPDGGRVPRWRSSS